MFMVIRSSGFALGFCDALCLRTEQDHGSELQNFI